MARLVSVQSSCEHAERFSLSMSELRKLPFGGALDDFLNDFLGQDQSTSYVIWGGVAANLALTLAARSGVHYSFHDIELLLTRKNRIYSPGSLLDCLNERLAADPRFMMELGGRMIAKTKEGLLIDEWQRERVDLNDGDLHLNNVIFIVDRVAKAFFVEAPAGTIHSLLNGDMMLSMKGTSGLRDVHRLARRIYRTISKVIRFERVAGLRLSPEAVACLCGLIDTYCAKLHSYFSRCEMDTTECEAVRKWFAEAEINSVEEGCEWLYVKTVSETAKRLAGLYGLSSTDQMAFKRNFFISESGFCSFFNHPLLQLLKEKVPDPQRFTKGRFRSDLFKKCYAEFGSYQKPGAECLIAAYSLDISCGL